MLRGKTLLRPVSLKRLERGVGKERRHARSSDAVELDHLRPDDASLGVLLKEIDSELERFGGEDSVGVQEENVVAGEGIGRVGAEGDFAAGLDPPGAPLRWRVSPSVPCSGRAG